MKPYVYYKSYERSYVHVRLMRGVGRSGIVRPKGNKALMKRKQGTVSNRGLVTVVGVSLHGKVLLGRGGTRCGGGDLSKFI